MVTVADISPVIDGLYLWDAWPICTTDGQVARFGDTELWMILSAPGRGDPALRHDIARIRLVARRGRDWIDCGNLLPDDFAPGTREWAGSATTDGNGGIMLYFTATGRRGDPFSFEQRMFQTHGRIERGNDITIGQWTPPKEMFRPDGRDYLDTRTTQGGAGMIKGFRDPGFVRDPADGGIYMLFTASDGSSVHEHNGVIGIATTQGASWRLLPPVLSGDTLCNEFERPHVVVHDGLYYLFWSTQRHVFASGAPSGPNGLYGMVADCIAGPYRPLNGTGLVAANPVTEPTQTYSWLVLDTLEVVSFIDYWGMNGRTLTDHPELVESHFGGIPAPVFRIEIDGEATRIVASSTS